MNTHDATLSRINNLQVLRAFAAINVVIFHAIATASHYGTPVHYLVALKGWGISGVDIFFVISGFMMAQIGLHKNPTPARFMWDRIKRICPPYYFWTAMMLLISLAWPQIMHNQNIYILQYATTPLFLSQLVTAKFPALYVGWTLEYEMLFYVIFAICLFANNMKYALGLCMSILVLLVLFGISKPLVLEFGLGIVIAILVRTLTPVAQNKLAWPSFCVGLVSLTLTIVFRPDPQQPYLLIIGYGLPAALLVFGLVTIQQVRSKVLVLLGDASYSIYLVQVLTLPAVFKVFTALSETYRPSSDFAVILGVIATTAVGLTSYFAVELTAKRWLSTPNTQMTTIAKA